MQRRMWMFLFLLVIPVVAFLAAGAVQGKYDGEWRQAVESRYGAEAAKKAISITELCAQPEAAAQLKEVCFELKLMTWMKRAAVGTAALGLALLSLIMLAGRLAGARRELLWKVFGPLLRLTVFGLVFLIILHAALAMATIWYGESALTGRVHVQIMLLVGVGAISGAVAMSRAAFAMVQTITTAILGRPVDRASHPEIWRSVEGLARRLGTEPPQHIVAGLLPSFFVTEADVECPDASLSGRTLYLSLPLCRILTTGELEAVIGHELGHFRGDDTLFSRRFYPIYRGSASALEALARNTGGARSLALLPAIHTLSFFLESFARAESAVSRERELVADQAGAEGAGVRNMASALVKIHAFAQVWGDVCQHMTEAQIENASLAFARQVVERAGAPALEGLDEQRIPHPIDSHPPLSVRLEALGMALRDVSEAALQASPDQPAIGLFADVEALERGLTELQQETIVAHEPEQD